MFRSPASAQRWVIVVFVAATVMLLVKKGIAPGGTSSGQSVRGIVLLSLLAVAVVGYLVWRLVRPGSRDRDDHGPF